MADRVLIVGGGLAGLAAATALAERKVSVMLLESRPRLGGRASSFFDKTTETWIDNCQHVNLGCCTNFEQFCRSVGLSDLFRRESELFFIGPDGAINRLSDSWLPAPLHLLPAFSRLSYLSWPAKRSLARGLRALARECADDSAQRNFAEWLHAHGQESEVIERFWYVVLVSALSESLNRISVAQARKVFVDAFLAHRRGWQVQIPTGPLETLYGERLIAWLREHKVALQLQSGVNRMIVEGEQVTAVELRDGRRLTADHFVLAVPFHRVLPLLPGSLRSAPELAGIGELEPAPISSVHLWFDRPITTLPHAVLVDRLSQWMFNRSVLQDHRFGSNGELYALQIVISASRNLAGRSQEEIIAEVVRELTEIWPETAGARLMHSRLVTEHRAVFSPKPGSDDLRPVQQSPLRNLQLAGDWTKTGWPATMEGAVRSGYLAAENILKHLGRHAAILHPDLPVSRLSKLLFGLT